MREREILPITEQNDARILAEAAIAEIPALVTSDSAILGARQSDLTLTFQDAGLSVVLAVHPAELVRSLRRRQSQE